MFMANETTFIKLDRNIKEWRWYTNSNTFRVFVHLLLNANIKAKDFENAQLKRGELATSYDTVANALKLSNQQVRTAISHLKLTGEITVKRYSKFIVISIVNYARYQDKPTDKPTINQQSFNNQSTFNQQQYKKDKNIKNDKNIYIPPVVPQGDTITHTHTKETFGEFQNVKLTQKEYEQLKNDFLDKADKAIKFLDEYIEEKGYKSKSHNLAIRRWVIDAIDEKSKKEKISAKNDFEFNFTLDDIFEKPDLNTAGGENE